jgi:hypothetical protein
LAKNQQAPTAPQRPQAASREPLEAQNRQRSGSSDATCRAEVRLTERAREEQVSLCVRVRGGARGMRDENLEHILVWGMHAVYDARVPRLGAGARPEELGRRTRASTRWSTEGI